jgi:hypothetical protein
METKILMQGAPWFECRLGRRLAIPAAHELRTGSVVEVLAEEEVVVRPGQVSDELLQVVERHGAETAIEARVRPVDGRRRNHTSVHGTQVFQQVRLLLEHGDAQAAGERLLAGVHPQMGLEVPTHAERLAAILAPVLAHRHLLLRHGRLVGHRRGAGVAGAALHLRLAERPRPRFGARRRVERAERARRRHRRAVGARRPPPLVVVRVGARGRRRGRRRQTALLEHQERRRTRHERRVLAGRVREAESLTLPRRCVGQRLELGAQHRRHEFARVERHVVRQQVVVVHAALAPWRQAPTVHHQLRTRRADVGGRTPAEIGRNGDAPIMDLQKDFIVLEIWLAKCI